VSRPLLMLLALLFPAAMGPAQGSSPGQGLFTPASHLWVAAGPGLEPIIRTYRLADLDGDGYAEYPIHGGTNTANLAPGWVRIMDGRSGLLKQEWVGGPQPTNCPFQVTTGEYYGRYGAALDLNGDGLRQEVVAGTWNAIVSCWPPTQVGRAELRSFPQGVPLLSLTPADSGNFGVPVENVGDLDGDGAEEVLIGAPSWSGNTGKVRILSGMGLTELYSYTGWHNGQLFGNIAAGGRDVDGDGFPDFILGAPYTYYPPTTSYNAGTARLYSGLTGSMIREHLSTTANVWRGQSVEILDDTDGDGQAEYVIVDSYCCTTPLPATGSAIRFYSGATGVELFSVNGLGGMWHIDRLEDVTGDGISDLLVATTGTEFSPWAGLGWLSVLSGADGSVAYQATTVYTGVNPMFPSGLGDVNGDGVEDIGTVVLSMNGPYVGEFRAYTWTNLLLSGVLYPGGSATFLVKTPSRPGRPFRLGLSTGAGGFMLGPFWVSVTPDALFFDTASALGGTLDALGTGSVTLPIPPFPALSGLTLYATGAVLEPGQAFPVGVVLNRVTVQIQ
jgi:FG-GAP repeat protein